MDAGYRAGDAIPVRRRNQPPQERMRSMVDGLAHTLLVHTIDDRPTPRHGPTAHPVGEFERSQRGRAGAAVTMGAMSPSDDRSSDSDRAPGTDRARTGDRGSEGDREAGGIEIPARQPPPETRRSIAVEIVIVLSFTFGLSGLSSALGLLRTWLEARARGESLGQQSVALSTNQSAISLIDLALQLLPIIRLCAWAALVVYLLWRAGHHLARVGFSWRRVDLLHGFGLAAAIGLPGLAFYLVAVAAGFNLTVVPTAIDADWWRVPVLVGQSVANALAEEILVVAYVMTRLRDCGWSNGRTLIASALLRGSYHLYQGLGGGLGNLVMGLVFGAYWLRYRRVWPLVVAHATIDIVAFVGYALLRERLSWLPG